MFIATVSYNNLPTKVGYFWNLDQVREFYQDSIGNIDPYTKGILDRKGVGMDIIIEESLRGMNDFVTMGNIQHIGSITLDIERKHMKFFGADIYFLTERQKHQRSLGSYRMYFSQEEAMCAFIEKSDTYDADRDEVFLVWFTSHIRNQMKLI